MRVCHVICLASLGAALIAGLTGAVAVNRMVSLRRMAVVEARTARQADGALRVMIIGDSWAAGRKFDAMLAAALDARGRTNEVRSHGIPGARSRGVYDWLMADRVHSPLWSAWQPDVCVVLVGVNDYLSGVGPQYYAHHIACIQSALSQRGIVPLVVQIPEVELHSTPTLALRLRTRLMEATYQRPLDEYRAGSSAIVPVDALTQGDLLPDGVHPSLEGRRKLAEVIATTLH